MTVFVRPWRGDTTGKKWEVDIKLRWADGTQARERKRSRCTSRSAAERWGEQREQVLIREHDVPVKEATPVKDVPVIATFWSRYIDHCEAEHQKASTLEHKQVLYKAHLAPFLGTRRLDEVRNADVAAIKSRLKEQTKKATNNVLAVLSTMLKVAVELEIIEVVPVTVKYLPIAKRSEKPFYEMPVYEKLVDAAAATDVRIEVLLLLFGDAGLRRGEAIGLDWATVSLERRQLDVVQRQWKGDVDVPKGGVPRLGLSMTTRLCQALARLPQRTGRVLVDDEGKQLTAYRVRKWIEAAEAKAGLPVTKRSHILRHSFCSHLAALGVPSLEIQHAAGHSDLATTEGYMHLSPGRSKTSDALDKARANALAAVEAGRRLGEAQN